MEIQPTTFAVTITRLYAYATSGLLIFSINNTKHQNILESRHSDQLYNSRHKPNTTTNQQTKKHSKQI